MKAIALSLSLLASFVVHADPQLGPGGGPKCFVCLLGPATVPVMITLGAEKCPGYFCIAVPNDAGATVTYIDWSAHYERLIVKVNGVTYDSQPWTVKSLTNAVAYSPTGAPLYASLTFNLVQYPCGNEGTGKVCPSIVTLTGGTLVTP